VAEQTYQRVCRVIGELAAIDPTGIGPGQSLGYEQTPNFYWNGETPPKPLELDSLDLWQLIMALEEEFGISVSDAEAHEPSLDHVGGLVAFVQGKLDARGDKFARFGVEIAGAQPAFSYVGPIAGQGGGGRSRERRIFEAGHSSGHMPFDAAWRTFAQREGLTP
jgi:acyl carrier protein